MSDVPVVHQATAAISHFTEDVRLLQGVDAEYLLCLLVFAVLTVFYTTFGGFRAVVWTDILQGFVMVTGVLVMMALALYQVGGLRSATEKLAKMTPPEYGTVLFETPAPTASDVRIESDTWFTKFGGRQLPTCRPLWRWRSGPNRRVRWKRPWFLCPG